MLEGSHKTCPTDSQRPVTGQILTANRDPARGRLDKATDQVESRALAGTVRPNEAKDFTGFDREAELVCPSSEHLAQIGA